MSPQNRMLRVGVAALALVAACAAVPALAQGPTAVAFETEWLDLDAGEVVEPVLDDEAPAGTELKLAYHADVAPHAVIVLGAEPVEMAYLAGVSCADLSPEDVPGLAFSDEPFAAPFSAADCAVIRTDQGAVFALGDPVEDETSVTFDTTRLD